MIPFYTLTLSHFASPDPRKAASRCSTPPVSGVPVRCRRYNTRTAAFVHSVAHAVANLNMYIEMRDYYQLVLSVICRQTGFDEVQLLHDRHELTTDARHLLLHLLGERLTNQDIVNVTRLPKQTVSRLLNGYRMRCKQKYSLRCLEAEVRREMETEV